MSNAVDLLLKLAMPCGESKKLDLKFSLRQFLFISAMKFIMSSWSSNWLYLAVKGFEHPRIWLIDITHWEQSNYSSVFVDLSRRMRDPK